MAIDADKLQEFLGRFIADLGATVAAGNVVIGHRLVLYQALAAGPARAEELAARTQTSPRYIAEWLRGQAAGGLAVIVADPAYTSRWGREHWLAPLQDHSYPVPASGHHAAAVVIGRRALGHRARRRTGVTGGGQRTSRRRATPGAPVARQTTRNGRPRQAQRQPPRWPKTATADQTSPPDQATQDRPGPPATQDHVLFAQ